MPFPLAAAAIIGGASLLGTAINAYSNDKARKAEQESRNAASTALTANRNTTDNQYRNIINSVDNYYANREGLGQAGDIEAYRNAISSYDPNEYVADINDFQFDKTKEDYINPYYARIIGDTTNQIQHSAAGAGLGRGTGAALNIAKGTAEKSDELYRTAMADYIDERDFAYQKYADAIRNNQSRLNALREGTQYKLGLQGSLANDYINTQDQAFADRMKAEQDRMAARQAYDTALVGLY